MGGSLDGYCAEIQFVRKFSVEFFFVQVDEEVSEEEEVLTVDLRSLKMQTST